jgi:hypothetical protein
MADGKPKKCIIIHAATENARICRVASADWRLGWVYFLTLLVPSRDNRSLALTARSASLCHRRWPERRGRLIYRSCRVSIVSRPTLPSALRGPQALTYGDGRDRASVVLDRMSYDVACIPGRCARGRGDHRTGGHQRERARNPRGPVPQERHGKVSHTT